MIHDNRLPLDEHALVERLMEWELEAQELEKHMELCRDGSVTKIDERRYDHLFGVYRREKESYRRVIDLIQNGRVRQQHRQLVPAGWSEVD